MWILATAPNVVPEGVAATEVCFEQNPGAHPGERQQMAAVLVAARVARTATGSTTSEQPAY